uniref:Zinc transporter ZIP14 n=1 Tax=Aceria tosichella TaxID=561515 RepID=A0A6G1SDL4_9ACAR
MKPAPLLMWSTATFMVLIVSCCSLVGVSIMPLISGPFYKSSITLLTGLAVGSLLGSAIFSLIPQAFALHLQADKSYLWKSLIIFFGIYLFYLSERLMRIYFERKERKNSDLHLQEQIQLKRNKSNDGRLNDNQHVPDEGDVPNASGVINLKAHDKTRNDTTTEISLARDHHEEANDSDHVGASSHGHSHSHSHHSQKSHEVIRKALKGEKVTEITPRRVAEIAPVAWMIIIGDGLHNFIDGLSIGAAFTESIHQGMIICVAVIFEELPHELGDFAVLISSGMTVRQALFFNFLSASTCFIGMIFGILLGDMAQSASYIFALAAGMFFYISLVDMMGELSAALEECKGSTRESIHLLLMQNIGILSGIVIIFSLSLFGPGG